MDQHIDSQFVIDSAYNVTGVGLVVGGTVTKGRVELGSTMMLGPDKQGHFKPVVIKGIHENRTNMEFAERGQTICCAIKNLNKKDAIMRHKGFKKGMSMLTLDKNFQPSTQAKHKGNVLDSLSVREFDAEVKILQHATTIEQN